MNTSHESLRLTLALSPTVTDVYGQRRILSKREIALHAIARSVLIGVILGFAVAIFLLYVHQNAEVHTDVFADLQRIAWQEVSP